MMPPADDPSSPPGPGRRRGRWVLLALMVVHAGLLLGGLRGNYVVLDEVGHIPAGVSHWQSGSFALYRVNPPLGRMLAALPVLLARPRVDYAEFDASPGVRSEWAFGRKFAEINGPRYFDLVCLARLPGVGWSLLGAWLIYRWGRELYGDAAGCLGAALWCFDPTIISFAQVVTPDIPSAVAGLGATYVFWRSLRRPSWSTTALAGLLLGVAQLTKFTMLVLYGIWPLLWLAAYRPWRRLRAGARRLARPVLGGLLVIVLSLDVINLGYAFQDSFRPLGRFAFVSRTFGGKLSVDDPGKTRNRFRHSWLGAVPIPVPAEYLQGVDSQRLDFESKFPSYLAGEWRDHGWWYYYAYALAVKEPLATSALVAWGLGLTLARRRAPAGLADELAVWLPAVVVLLFVSSQTGFNHHMRYVLPAFPFVAVATGKLACFFRPGRRAAGALVLGLLAWSTASSLAVYPHSMSYFNEAAGGPEGGPDHLLDSNIDWGQDLLHLKRWLDDHPEARPLGLAYFHFLDPRLAGIDFSLPPPGPHGTSEDVDAERWAAFGPLPGFYALSVNFLHGTTFLVANGAGGMRSIDRHDYFAYFRRFRPIARAGYSIYIYRITPAEAERERRRLSLPPLPTAGRDATLAGRPAPNRQGVPR